MGAVKYHTKEEKRKAQRDQQNSYAEKDWKCDVCNIVIRLGNKANHLYTRKHCVNLSCASGPANVECMAGKTWKCDVCDSEINLHSKYNHLISNRHIKKQSIVCNDSDSGSDV